MHEAEGVVDVGVVEWWCFWALLQEYGEGWAVVEVLGGGGGLWLRCEVRSEYVVCFWGRGFSGSDGQWLCRC